MFKIIKKYRHLLSRRAADDFNSMAAFLTNLCGDQSIDLHRPDEPTADNPPSIRVNEDWLEKQKQKLLMETAAVTDTAGTGHDISTTALLAEKAPKEGKPLGSSETDEQKIERIGTSPRAAREDHQHPVMDNGATPKDLTSGFSHVSQIPAWNALQRNTDTWTRGNTDTSGKPCGFTCYLPTLMIGDGNDAYIMWRKWTFDQCGSVRGVAAENSYANACNVTMTEDDE